MRATCLLCSLDCAPPPEPLRGDDALVELDDAQPPEPLDDSLVELEARVPAIATMLPFSCLQSQVLHDHILNMSLRMIIFSFFGAAHSACFPHASTNATSILAAIAAEATAAAAAAVAAAAIAAAASSGTTLAGSKLLLGQCNEYIHHLFIYSFIYIYMYIYKMRVCIHIYISFYIIDIHNPHGCLPHPYTMSCIVSCHMHDHD